MNPCKDQTGLPVLDLPFAATLWTYGKNADLDN